MTVISHNVLTALKRLALPAELLTAQPKRLRFLLFYMPGRLVNHARSLLLRLAAVREWIGIYRKGLRQLPVMTSARLHQDGAVIEGLSDPLFESTENVPVLAH